MMEFKTEQLKLKIKKIFTLLLHYSPMIMLVVMVERGLMGWGWGLLFYVLITLAFPLARYLRRREDYNMMIRTGVMDPIETMICGRPFRFIEGGPKARLKVAKNLKRKMVFRKNENKKP